MKSNNIISTEYKNWLHEIKQNFQNSQIKATVNANSILIEFYWNLGNQIVQKQKQYNWGSSFLKQLSHDLIREFPDIKGFSLSNLQYIRRWYLFYTKSGTSCSANENIKVEQVVPQLFLLPLGHNFVIISKCKDINEASFYVKNSIQNNISRNVLINQIESNLYQREGKAITNFEATLPKIQSDLAKQITKDPYNFEFLTLTKGYKEKELENALCENITNFLLELGSGFAFVGRQYKLNIGDEEFRIDLLFYHLKLRCYVVVELKAGDFKPEFAGKLNFYTNAIDGEVKQKEDNPTIGILICKSKKDIVVEYALKGINNPLGISEYQLTEALPKEYKSSLPTIEEIEAGLNDE